MSDDLNIEKVKAAIRKQRVDAGQTPATGTSLPSLPPKDLPALASSEDLGLDKVRAMLRQTRACAIKNAQSSEQLKEAQAATPGRGIQTSKLKTRGATQAPGGAAQATPGGAAQATPGDAKQKKEKSS